MPEKMMSAIKCKNCGTIRQRKHARCPKCRKTDFEEVTVGEGRLLSFTKLKTVPEGVERSPLVLGIVELQNGAKVVGQIESDEPEIGMRLVPEYAQLRRVQGREVWGFRFRRP